MIEPVKQEPFSYVLQPYMNTLILNSVETISKKKED